MNNGIDILLVNPPVNRLCNYPSNYFPLGIGYIAAMTNRLGYKTKIYNAEFEATHLPILTNRDRINHHNLFIDAINCDGHPVWEEFRNVIKTYKPRVIGFSCTSASITSCLKMAADAKKNGDIVIVFGGMHPTILPQETAEYPEVDYIIVGEGEKSFSSLMTALFKGNDPSGIPGVGGTKGGKFFLNDPEPLQEEIEIFPFPDRESLLFLNKQKKYLQAIITSRGCPYQCTFCSGRKIHQGCVRFRPIDKVLDEIEYLKTQYGIKHIVFYDDSFVLNKKRAIEICNEIIRRKLKITWSAFSRADSVDPDILRLMKKSGCIGIGIGVESGSDNTLKKIKKGYTRDKAIKGINLVKEAGINVSINMIIGFPFETEDDILESISLIEELNVPTNVNTFTPYPGSEIFKEYFENGHTQKKKINWLQISQHSPYNTFIQAMSQTMYRILLRYMVDVADCAGSSIKRASLQNRAQNLNALRDIAESLSGRKLLQLNWIYFSIMIRRLKEIL